MGRRALPRTRGRFRLVVPSVTVGLGVAFVAVPVIAVGLSSGVPDDVAAADQASVVAAAPDPAVQIGSAYRLSRSDTAAADRRRRARAARAVATRRATEASPAASQAPRTVSATPEAPAATAVPQARDTAGSEDPGAGDGDRSRPRDPFRPPVRGGRPGPTNTGVPAGTGLTVHYGDLVIRKPGTRIDALDVHGFVVVKAPDVVISRSIIRGGRATGNIGLVTNTTPSATGLVIEDSELVPEYPSLWIDGVKGANFTVRRVNVHGVVDNVKVHGDTVRVEGSWLHDAKDYDSDPNQGGRPSHNDGVQVLGGRGISIVGNSITGASNAALMVTQDYSATTDLAFVGNWADGGMCTVNLAHKKLASMTGITVSNNRFGRGTRVADCAVLSSKMTELVAEGNVWDDNGTPNRIRRNG